MKKVLSILIMMLIIESQAIGQLGFLSYIPVTQYVEVNVLSGYEIESSSYAKFNTGTFGMTDEGE
jgi:hypothetical protein